MKDYVRKNITKQVVGYGVGGKPILKLVSIETSIAEDLIDYSGDDVTDKFSPRELRQLTSALHVLRMVTTTMTPAQRDVFTVRWCDALDDARVIERIAIMADAVYRALSSPMDGSLDGMDLPGMRDNGLPVSENVRNYNRHGGLPLNCRPPKKRVRKGGGCMDI